MRAMEVDESAGSRRDGGAKEEGLGRASIAVRNVDDDNLLGERENQPPPQAQAPLQATQVVTMEQDEEEDPQFPGSKGQKQQQEQQREQEQQQQQQQQPPTSSSSSSSSPPLSAEQRAALAAIASGLNVFVTGAAGTGKSVLLRAAIELLRSKFDAEEEGGEEEREPSSSSSSVAVVAPTGVAAAAVGGSTIHAFAGCGLARSNADLDKMRRGFPAERWRLARALVVDEVSMLSGEFLSELDAAARSARGEPRRSFGGIQLVLVGDFAQLAPVGPSSSSNAAAGFSLRHRGFAFQSPAWRAARLVPFLLTVAFRQSGGGQSGIFLRLLAEIRVGDPSGRAMAELLRRCGGRGREAALASSAAANNSERRRQQGQRPLLPPPSSTSSRLYCLNKDVDLENAKRLAELPGAFPITFRASDELKVLPSIGGGDKAGATLRLSKCSFLRRDCLARGEVELKERALVMLLKNGSFGGCGGGGGGGEGAAATTTTTTAAGATTAATTTSSSSLSPPPSFPLVNGSMGLVLGFATVRALKKYAHAHVGYLRTREKEKKRRKSESEKGFRARKRARAAVAGERGDGDDGDGDSSSSSSSEEEGEEEQEEEASKDERQLHQLASWCVPRASASAALLLLNGGVGKRWLEANRGENGNGNGNESENDRALLPVVRFFAPPSASSASNSSQGRVEVVAPALFTSEVPGTGSVERTQLPLRLAWALSVHKCQGMTLERVTVCLRGAFACGQAYVALSRARSLEGLSIELGNEGNDGGEGGERVGSVVRADPLVARFDAAVAAATAAATRSSSSSASSNGFRERASALAAFKCRIFGARTSLAVDAVEAAASGGGGGGGAKGRRRKKKKAAAEDGDDADDDDNATARRFLPPPSAAEILSGIQCYSCRGWGHVVAACPQSLARKKKKKKKRSNGG